MQLIKNIIETFYGVTSWGKQAKTVARSKRKPLIDEVRHERNFYQRIDEHKEVFRALQVFNSGVMSLQPPIDDFCKKLYQNHCHLWSENMEKSLKEFADSEPLTADVRDKFKLFDQQTEQLKIAEKSKTIGAIKIYLDEVFDGFIEFSKLWKKTLAKYLSDIYRKKLISTIDTINDIELVLNRELKDLDDINVAMKCLERVRAESIE